MNVDILRKFRCNTGVIQVHAVIALHKNTQLFYIWKENNGLCLIRSADGQR
jgi:hypothetical protein